MLNDLGVDSIATDLLDKRNQLVPELLNKGYHVLNSAGDLDNASGIVTFHKPQADMSKLVAKLEQVKIKVSLRFMRDGSKLIRLSPHFYNTTNELNRLLNEL